MKQTCSQCNQQFEEATMVHFTDHWVCSDCKETYVQQLKEGVDEEETADDKLKSWIARVSPEYSSALKLAIPLQVLGLLMAAMILDGGQVAQYYLVGLIASWICTLAIMIQRPENPSKLDLLFIRWGWLPVAFTTPYIMAFVWHLRGVRL